MRLSRLLGLVTCLFVASFTVTFPDSCSLSTATPSETGVRVARVVDGDTVVLATGERVRYIGIDTPEMDPEEPFAREAAEANRRLVEGKVVRLEKDVSETDRYGRLLRYVWVGGKFVNLELVKQGLAEAREYPPDTKYSLIFEAAETEARLGHRGMWATANSTSTAFPACLLRDGAAAVALPLV